MAVDAYLAATAVRVLSAAHDDGLGGRFWHVPNIKRMIKSKAPGGEGIANVAVNLLLERSCS